MRLLDLFCGAGGAGAGYARAGFEVTGVDIRPQPRYPFRFVQGDALEYVRAHGRDFDVIHASPPCQAYTQLRNLRTVHHPTAREAPELIEPTRAALRATGRPYIIENVIGAPLFPAVVLCGSYFKLKVRRHRVFESSIVLLGTPCSHRLQGETVGVWGHTRGLSLRDGKRRRHGVDEWRKAMGIDWMTCLELAQSIPPAYTHFLGLQLKGGATC